VKPGEAPKAPVALKPGEVPKAPEVQEVPKVPEVGELREREREAGRPSPAAGQSPAA
jgi:hypothetical protein